MKLLLTNDDGIDAPGLRALLEAAAPLGEPLLVAPAHAHSGCGHRVTTDAPFRVTAPEPGRYAVEGTPADCVRVGLHRLMPDAAWVLSGINAGGNLGADVWHSGTVAAAREAVLHGWPAVAISQYRKRGLPLDWDRAARWAVAVLRDLLATPWERGTFWNINLPHPSRAPPTRPPSSAPSTPRPSPSASAPRATCSTTTATTTSAAATTAPTWTSASAARSP
jgi:5'-nucleotidase